MGVYGLTLRLHVYGVHPKLRLPNSKSTAFLEKEHLSAQRAALQEHAKVVDEQRLTISELAKPPSFSIDRHGI